MQLEKTSNVTPTPELQNKKIAELSGIPCSFGLIVELDIDKITPVPGVPFPFKAQAINNKAFCKLIHPSYLIPFLIFARFAYEMTANAAIKTEEILKASYRIPIPLKLPGKDEYMWFIQNGYALAVNQNNQVISHLNLYEFDRICLTLDHGEIEYRFVEASVLVDHNLHPVFQGYLKQKINEYLVSIFQKQYKQWKILELLKLDIHQSNSSLSASLNLTEETIKSYSKDILHKLRVNLGYHFISLREAVIALSQKGYL
jgi:DNA-binding CsgD family transcriptional regulator